MQALAHVMIRVRDFDVSLPFYSEILGFKEAFWLYHDDGTPWIAYLHVAGRQFVELSRHRDASGYATTAGYDHVCFEVDDVESWHRRLAPTGCVIPDSLKTGKDGSIQLWIKDPDGNRIELMQYTAESKQTAFLRRLESRGNGTG